MIAWLDIETTGLDPRRDLILEVGIIITDDQLNELDSTNVVIGYPLVSLSSSGIVAERLDANGGFTRKMHTDNGLLEEVMGSMHDTWSAEQRLLQLMGPIAAREKPVMGGSSVSFDRSFLAQWMPALLETFSYRSIDVSGIRELARRWRPDLTAMEPTPRGSHRPRGDIQDSIWLARFYQDNIFNVDGSHHE
jgi:oligoribonuclease